MMAEHTRAFMTGNKTYPNTDIRPFILTETLSQALVSTLLIGSETTGATGTHELLYCWNHEHEHVRSPSCWSWCMRILRRRSWSRMYARWIQLSTFARSHYNRTLEGKPLKKGMNHTTSKVSTSILEDLPLWQISILETRVHLRLWDHDVRRHLLRPNVLPLPRNDKLYTNIEESLMVVGALKVSPILVPGIKDACQCISLRENGQHGWLLRDHWRTHY